jgi:hypothetical protein
VADILDLLDVQELRKEVKKKYQEVAEKPGGAYHFHTGRSHAIRLGYPQAILDQPAKLLRAWPTRFTGKRHGLASES